ncbi:flagellar hook-length control protein FliK [Rheinheimera mangrovi]|uniref:flagellar hook-length control protein FliK n=1 Tax=Rheinheimera mangrovi TaxID=2498451 RepID=UPI000F8CE657|nr:flagellar hook-length control protein FliK [Rheinheimera mangrovi]
MAEFLSMTLLNAEPVPAAKPQVMQSNDGASEPDQSFAATLATEVNGKHPEKSAKSLAKTRQNNASDSADSKGATIGQGTTSSDVKNDNPKSVSSAEVDAVDEDVLLSAGSDSGLVQNDKDEAEQSHWLNLLEKAKSLQQRLSKTDSDNKDAAKEAAAVSAAVVVQETLTTTEHNDKAKAQTILDTQSIRSDKAKTGEQKDGSIVLDEKLLTDQGDVSRLTAEELKAIKSLAQTGNTVAGKNQTADTALKQTATSEPEFAVSEAKEKITATDKLQSGVQKDTGPDQSKTTAHIEKQLKAMEQTAQTAQSAEAEKPLKVATETNLGNQAEKQPKVTAETSLGNQAEKQPKVTSETSLVNQTANPIKAKSEIKQFNQPEKTLQAITETDKLNQAEHAAEMPGSTTASSQTILQSEPARAVPKSNAIVTPDSKIVTESESETVITPTVMAEPKVSVQAQSAAALIAPAAQQAKAPATEAKVTTEEVLKQVQSGALTTQGEQGASSSSSGEPSQQGSAETILTVTEQQKGSHTLATDTNSFSNQLKSSLEKTSQAISVSGREMVSEASQKQVDQLGQKLNLIQPEASNQLKEKMLMMVKDKVHTAEIRLDPSELGSMQIKINLQQDQMSVQFTVQQGNAKELMEQQMPKLKELLQQQGIELSQGSVQQQNQSSAGQEGGRRAAGGNSTVTALNASDETVDPVLLPTKNSDRVVDYYA